MEIVDLAIMICSGLSVLYLLTAFLAPPARLDVENTADDPSLRAASAMKDLEFDFSAGKLSREDYESARRHLVEELALSMKKGRTPPK